MLKHSKISTGLFLILALLTGIAQAELRIGFVNTQMLLKQAPQATSATARLQEEFAPRERDLVDMQKQLRALEERLARDAAVMADAERQTLEREVLTIKRDLKRNQDMFREDASLRRNEELAKLQRLIVETIRALAVEQGFDLIVTDGVLFASENVDATALVLDRLTRLYESKPQGN